MFKQFLIMSALAGILAVPTCTLPQEINSNIKDQESDPVAFRKKLSAVRASWACVTVIGIAGIVGSIYFNNATAAVGCTILGILSADTTHKLHTSLQQYDSAIAIMNRIIGSGKTDSVVTEKNA